MPYVSKKKKAAREASSRADAARSAKRRKSEEPGKGYDPFFFSQIRKKGMVRVLVVMGNISMEGRRPMLNKKPMPNKELCS